jgi:alanyl-tRNA synthetase
MAAAANNDRDVFKIDLIWPIIEAIQVISHKSYEDIVQQAAMRVIADHMRAAIFLIAAGVAPANKMQGYYLRRLLRRSLVKFNQLGLHDLSQLCETVINVYQESYLKKVDLTEIKKIIRDEENRFGKTLSKGLKVIQQTPEDQITGKFAFDLYQTFGFPLEVTEELVKEKGIIVDRQSFREEFKKHQDISRAGSQALFKGGLADSSEIITKYHTTTHLLQATLRQVLGDHIQQMGSNITAERLRFDFKHGEKVTSEQLKQIEGIINQKIKEDLPVHKTIEDKEIALKSGAMAFFRDKYPDKVSVYTIGLDQNKNWFSKELCGGPHVSSTGVIGPVTIKKEEAVGAGVRRIYMTIS